MMDVYDYEYTVLVPQVNKLTKYIRTSCTSILHYIDKTKILHNLQYFHCAKNIA